MQPAKLNGMEKAAILLIALGSDLSSRVLKKEFLETEIEQLTKEISNMTHVPAETTSAVLDEFMKLQQAREYLLHGGLNYAREMLEKALGNQKASDILNKLTSNMKAIPFSSLRKTDPKQLLNFIRDEHPQTIALILVHLTPEQAAVILASLPPELQSEISKRIASIDRLTPDVVKSVEAVLENKLSSVLQQDHTAVGGVQSLVNILNRVGRSAEKVILEGLEREDPDLADEVKMHMFVFEDIKILSDQFIQRVLKEVDFKDLALAMRGANEEVHARIYKNMSKRAADMLREEIEFMGPVRLKEVEQAQQKIVTTIRKLDESGEIIISWGGDDVIL
ncbi:Flagellar motor switch protein FliG [Pelotomaculum schinkii]|uniref:Flagellar motor switch protein FliG n=1 Tax=Pelotomaculum schinkii TaxID=78350 RepID=A0A4Y7R7J2_9FIRM|nr:flagellar motor switch protein FliG [Pelotomaculum schinkii]TEB04934.1 Flagellar motor switch protein FliG [Pelotomaculum schinkii]